MFSLYALPSIIALSLKLLLFWCGRRYLISSSPWLLLFLMGLFGINALELLGFYYVSNPEAGLTGLTAYYIFIEISFFSLLALSLDSAKKLNTIIKSFLFTGFILSVIPLLIPGAALAGVASIGYSVTRIAGPYYFVVQLGILLPLISSISILCYFSWFGINEAKVKSRVLLVACSPILISVMGVVILMQLEYPVNASIIMSLMITLTMLILLLNERKNGTFHFIDKRYIYNFTRFIPKSRDHLFIKKIVRLVIDPAIGLAKGRELIEQEMLREALNLADGSKTKAAAILGISRQTLVRLLKKNTGQEHLANEQKI